MAVLLPDDSGVRLIDALSGAPFSHAAAQGSSVVGVLGDPGGHRLVTIETESDEALIGRDGRVAGLGPVRISRHVLWSTCGTRTTWMRRSACRGLPHPGPPPRPGPGSGPSSGVRIVATRGLAARGDQS